MPIIVAEEITVPAKTVPMMMRTVRLRLYKAYSRSWRMTGTGD